MGRIEQYTVTQGADRKVFEDATRALDWAIESARADRATTIGLPNGDEIVVIKRSHQYHINLVREV